MIAQTTIGIRPLSTCPFDEAVQIWNSGFEGYFVDLSLSLDRYLARLVADGVSPEHSLLASCEGKPAGFLLNALDVVAGKRVAWNGGTGVSPVFRKRGIASALMEATLDLYGEQGVELATLEAIRENQPAISLYRRFGFEIVDELIFLRHQGAIDRGPFHGADRTGYSVKAVAPHAVSELGFYRYSAPWQTQWLSLQRNNGEAVIVCDSNGAEVGYALSKRKLNAQGQLESIALFQCVVDPVRADMEAIVGCALRHLYAPLDIECRRMTHNLSRSNELVPRMLLEAGFTPFVEQVQMARSF